MGTSISEVEIGRMALAHIGSRSNIESFTADSAQARQILLFYSISRGMALEALDWSFARRTKALAGHAEPPTNNWQFRYSLPTDCIAPRIIPNPIGRQGDHVPFSREIVGESETILTDLPEASLTYTADVTYTPLFTYSFTYALSVMLGANAAPNLVGDAGHKIKLELMDEFETLIAKAADSNANSEKPDKERDAIWIRER